MATTSRSKLLDLIYYAKEICIFQCLMQL